MTIGLSIIVFAFGLLVTGIVALGVYQEREHEATNRRKGKNVRKRRAAKRNPSRKPKLAIAREEARDVDAA